MIATAILLALAVAGVTHSWFSGSLFLPIQKQLASWRGKQGWHWFPLRLFARGALCSFCFSHWVAIACGIGLYVAPQHTMIVATVAASVFLAGQALTVFRIVTEQLPQLIGAKIGSLHGSRPSPPPSNQGPA